MDKREALIARTIAEWQGAYKEPLTRQDALEIIANVTGFFRLLEKWELEDRLRAGRGGLPPSPGT